MWFLPFPTLYDLQGIVKPMVRTVRGGQLLSEHIMRIASKTFPLTFQDYPEKNATASIVYIPGCNRNCLGCHNLELQSPTYGEEISIEDLCTLTLRWSRKNRTKNLVISGGDPLQSLPDLREYVKTIGYYLDVCIYTGAKLPEILKADLIGFKYIIGGRYDRTQKNERSGKSETKFVLATRNQFILNSEYQEISIQGVLKYE